MPLSAAGASEFDVAAAVGFNARDLCDPNPAVSASHKGPFPEGETRVVLTATDASGNRASTDVVVRVRGSQAPGTPPVPRADVPVTPPRPPTPGARSGAELPTAGGPRASSPAAVPGAAAVSLPAPTPGVTSVARATAAGEAGAAPLASRTGTVPVAAAAEVRRTSGSRAWDGRAWTLWWILAVGGVLLAGLFVLARGARRRRAPSQPAVVQTVPKKDLGNHAVVFPTGLPQPRYEVRLRPRVDHGEQRVDASAALSAGE
jgi:hypothetical protein